MFSIYIYIYIYIERERERKRCIYIYIFLFPISYKEKTRRRSTHTPHTIDSVAHFVALASNFSEQIEKLKLLVDFEPTPKSSKKQHFQKPPQNTKSQTLRRQGLDFYTDFDDFWHPFFHHCSRPPNFHTLQHVTYQTRFLTRSGAWISDLLPCFSDLFFNVFGWFSSKESIWGPLQNPFGAQIVSKIDPARPKSENNIPEFNIVAHPCFHETTVIIVPLGPSYF